MPFRSYEKANGMKIEVLIIITNQLTLTVAYHWQKGQTK